MATVEQTRQAAVHEAGHACAAQRFGWGIEWVSCLPNAERKGGSRLVPRIGEALPLAVEHITVSLVADLVVREIAGDTPQDFGMQRFASDDELREFEHIASGAVLVGYVESSDVTRAEQAAADATSTDAEAALLLAFGDCRARTLARDNGFQTETLFLSLRLAERGELSGLLTVSEILRARTLYEREGEPMKPEPDKQERKRQREHDRIIEKLRDIEHRKNAPPIDKRKVQP
jgi:hypothetical protein